MGDVVNLTPVPPDPSDKELDEFFESLISEHNDELQEVLHGLKETISHTENEGQPVTFSYGKLINYIGTLEHPELVRILSAALWELA